eukprot:1954089-Pleurochrysis_carterae.AAC.1
MRDGKVEFEGIKVRAIGHVDFNHPSARCHTDGLAPFRIRVFKADADGKALVGGLEFTSETIH